MEYFIAGIHVIMRESYIKARVIKIKTTGERQIEKSCELANNGISPLLASHGRIKEGYQMFLQPDADGEEICEKILDELLPLSYSGIVLERINC